MSIKTSCPAQLSGVPCQAISCRHNRRPFWILVSMLAVITLTTSGCFVSNEQPIWMADSSGVVGRDEEGVRYFDIATKESVKIPSPWNSDTVAFDIVLMTINPFSKKVVHAGVKWDANDEQKAQKAQITIWVAPNLTAPPAHTFQLQVELTHGDQSDPLDIHLSPDSKNLLLRVGEQTVIVNLDSHAVLTLPNVTTPLYFNLTFGVSPCRPDGAGFIAFLRKDNWTLKSALKFDKGGKRPFERILDGQSQLIFVSWDGKYHALKSMEVLKEASIMFNLCFYDAPDQEERIHVSRYVGQSSWQGKSLRFSSGGAQLEIDTDTNEIRYVRSNAVNPEAYITKVLNEYPSVDLGNGESRVFVRPHGTSSETSSPDRQTLEVVVLDQRTSTERVVDIGDPGEWFALQASPDSTSLILSCWRLASTELGGYSVLLDQGGDYLTSFGITKQAWHWDVVDKQIGLPDLTGDDIADGGVISPETCSDNSLKYIVTASGVLGGLRDIRYVEVIYRQKSSTLTMDGLKQLALLPLLRSLKFVGFDPSDLLSSLPQLEELSGEFSDSILARVPTMDKMRSVTLDRESRVTKSEIQDLAKFLHLKELHVYANLPKDAWEEFHHLPELSILDIRCDTGNVGSIKNLEQLHNLKSLHVGESGITNDSLSGIGMAKDLETLRIVGSVAEPVQLLPLRSLTSLKTLNIHISERTGTHPTQKTNLLKGVSLAPLRDMQELENLSLGGLAIEDSDLLELQALKSLKRVHLGQAECSAAALMKLSAAIPSASFSIYVNNGQETATYAEGRLDSIRSNRPSSIFR